MACSAWRSTALESGWLSVLQAASSNANDHDIVAQVTCFGIIELLFKGTAHKFGQGACRAGGERLARIANCRRLCMFRVCGKATAWHRE